MMADIPDCNRVFANEYGTTVFLKNVVKAPNIEVGDYTYYDDAEDPTAFEKRCVLFNYPEFFPEKLIIGKFCAIAQGVQFMMGAANHRLNSLSTYPFNVMGGLWREKTTPHVSELPTKRDIVVGNDVWIGREAKILPGVRIGDGAIIGAYAVVAKDVPAYSVAVGNPARVVKKRFDDELIDLLERARWWDWPIEEITAFLPALTLSDVVSAKKLLKQKVQTCADSLQNCASKELK